MFFSLSMEVKVNNLGTGGVGMNIFAFTTDDEFSAWNVLTLSTCGFGPPELCLFYNDQYLDGTARPQLSNEFNSTWTPVTIVYTDGFLSMQTTGAAEIYDVSQLGALPDATAWIMYAANGVFSSDGYLRNVEFTGGFPCAGCVFISVHFFLINRCVRSFSTEIPPPSPTTAPTLKPSPAPSPIVITDCRKFCSLSTNVYTSIAVGNLLGTVYLSTMFTLSFSIKNSAPYVDNPENILQLVDANSGQELVQIARVETSVIQTRYNGMIIAQSSGVSVTAVSDGWRFTVSVASMTSGQMEGLVTPLDTTDVAYYLYASSPELVSFGGLIRDIEITGRHVNKVVFFMSI